MTKSKSVNKSKHSYINRCCLAVDDVKKCANVYVAVTFLVGHTRNVITEEPENANKYNIL